MNKKQNDRRPTTCVCGCGRPLVPGKTGQNFATPACVVRVMAADPRLRAQFGEDALQLAIQLLESKDRVH